VAASAGLRVEGARNLLRTLKRAGIEINDLRVAHGAASQVVAEKARVNAPKVTGRLAASVRGSGTKAAALTRAGNASVPYAGPIHWGWPARNIQAQPFLADAAEETQQVWLPIYEEALDRVLAQIRGV
jgi:hypothetical protein